MNRTSFFAWTLLIHISSFCYGQAPDQRQEPGMESLSGTHPGTTIQNEILNALNLRVPTNNILEQIQAFEKIKNHNLNSFNPADRTVSGQIPCNPNTFWANTLDSIYEFSLINSVITPTGIKYPNNGLYSLAYANDNFGISGMSPTFFSTSNQTGSVQLKAFNGSTWNTATTSAGIAHLNCAGSGNDLYCDGYSTSSPPFDTRMIFHYSGTNLDTIYNCAPGRRICVADEAADANGKIYVFIGPDSLTIVDTLLVLSPTGTILNSYPISFNNLNAYGSCILGDKLYVGFGPFSSLYPKSIVPIYLNQGTASVGTPIACNFFGGSFYDLESCNQGVPVGLADHQEMFNHLEVYPNPAQEYITIEIPESATALIKEVSLISIHGQQIQPEYQHLSSNLIQLNISNLPGGFYFVKISTGSTYYYGRFEHIKK